MPSRSCVFQSLFVRSHSILHHCPPYSASSSHTNNSTSNGNMLEKKSLAVEEVGKREEGYRQLQNLDFKTAARILFTMPPKRRKFGLDFHLVQLFFACMPSLAVYLVAQYARSEIRRMEAEAEQKKQAEEEKAAIDAESVASDGESRSELAEVKTRLEALEEAVKGIVDEKRKIVPGDPSRYQEAGKVVVASGYDKGSDKPGGTKSVAVTGTISSDYGKIQNRNGDVGGRSSPVTKEMK